MVKKKFFLTLTLLSNSGPFTAKKFNLDSEAIAWKAESQIQYHTENRDVYYKWNSLTFAAIVLPVPGGPTRRIPIPLSFRLYTSGQITGACIEKNKSIEYKPLFWGKWY